MKFYDVCKKKEYTDKKTNTVKVKWDKCGVIKVMDDGKMFLDLAMFDTLYIFEQKPKEQSEAF